MPRTTTLTLAALAGLAVISAAVAAPPKPVAPSKPKPIVVAQAPSTPAAPPVDGAVPLPPAVGVEKNTSSGGPTSPEENSRYAVLMDVDSGKILWSRNPDTKREIASTTKIMTAILLLERGKPDAVVTAPNGIDKVPESSLHLSPGETIPLHDLLYAMLLRSANDTAIAGADYLAGSVPAFADMMNEKAKEIGCTNTHFVTPNGLYDPNHYSTPADLALIARYAVLNLPEFDQIVRTTHYKVQRSMHKDDVWVKNTSTKFLTEFPGADGIKTGYISQAGHCFVGSATRNGWRLIAVALDSDKCREDVESILNYGFHDFKRVLVMHKNDAAGQATVPNAAANVPVVAAEDAVTAVSRWKPVPSFEYRFTPLAAMPPAPIAVGTKLGTISILANGSVQDTIDAVAAQSVAAKPVAAAIVPHVGGGGGFWRIIGNVLAAIALIILGGRIYARTVAKGSGGSRDRLPSQL